MEQESARDIKLSNRTDGADAPPEGNGKRPGTLGRRLRIFVPVLLVLGAIGVFSWRWYLGQRDFVSTDDAYVDADRVSISSKVLGRILTLAVDEGDTVHAGQVLVQLDASDLRAQQAQAQSAMTLATETVRLSQVNLGKAKQDLERAQAQFKAGVIPAEQLDHARNEFDAAQARLAISQAQVGTSHAQVTVTDTSLRNTTITAPMDGVVSRRWVLPGDVVQASQPIYTIYNLRDVWVTANLEETKLRALKIDDAVTVKVDAYPLKELTGRVMQFGTNTAAQFSLIPPNNASGNFTKVTQRVPVKIRLEAVPADVTLLPGMSVEVRVRVHTP
jgi:membrane fusion protein (multidrug efflux system)